MVCMCFWSNIKIVLAWLELFVKHTWKTIIQKCFAIPGRIKIQIMYFYTEWYKKCTFTCIAITNSFKTVFANSLLLFYQIFHIYLMICTADNQIYPNMKESMWQRYLILGSIIIYNNIWSWLWQPPLPLTLTANTLRLPRGRVVKKNARNWPERMISRLALVIWW